MFIVSIHYLKPLDVVDGHLPALIAFLDNCYTKGIFIASGRNSPFCVSNDKIL